MSKEIPHERSFASHPKSIFWSEKNGDVKPHQVTKSSNTKYWFNCNVCKHQFEIRLDNITNLGRWCPYCSNIKLCDNENCNICHDKSFASSSKSIFWSDKNKIKPRELFKGSKRKYWFNCNECLHIFESALTKINNDRWCPYCANQKLCTNENCTICFEKSFSSHPKSLYWDNKNKVKPRELFLNSNNNYWFDCNNCNHSFETSLSNINRDRWCLYCANKKLCTNKNCNICFEKSFASHVKAMYWSDKNQVKPREVFKNSEIKFWFSCDKNNKHIFESNLGNINSGSWCPFCVNKTETKLYELLTQIYTNFERQFKVDWCKKINYLPFDFVLEEYKIIIELDGEQHFIQVSNWSSPEEQLKNDLYKMKCANENGYSVIRILQEDVWNDKYNWLDELKSHINLVINEKKVQNIFMCKNNEYDKLKSNINWQN
jgi:very-short-patch-repair endonuclease